MVFSNSVKRAFNAGELSPSLFGRDDLEVYYQGLERCENFVPNSEGDVSYRYGEEFLVGFDLQQELNEINLNTNRPLLIFPFTYSQYSGITSYYYGKAFAIFYVNSVSGTNKIFVQLYPATFTNNNYDTGFVYSEEYSLDKLGLELVPRIGGSGNMEFYLYMAHPSSTSVKEAHVTSLSGWAFNTVSLVNSPFYLTPGVPLAPTDLKFFQGRLVYLTTHARRIIGSRAPVAYKGQVANSIMTLQILYTPTTGVFQPAVTLQSSGAMVQSGEKITGGTSGAIAVIDSMDAIGEIRVSGVNGAFQTGETITGSVSGATGAVTALNVIDQTYRFLDFTTGAYPDDGFDFSIDTLSVDEKFIWMEEAENFLVLGTNVAIYAITGSDLSALSAINIQRFLVSSVGSADVKPTKTAAGIVYVAKGQRRLIYLKFNPTQGSFDIQELTPAHNNASNGRFIGLTTFSGKTTEVIALTPGSDSNPEAYETRNFVVGSSGVGMYRTTHSMGEFQLLGQGVYNEYVRQIISTDILYNVYAIREASPDRIRLVVTTRSDIDAFGSPPTWENKPFLTFEDFYTGTFLEDQQSYFNYLLAQTNELRHLDAWVRQTSTNTVVVDPIFEGSILAVVGDGVFLGLFEPQYNNGAAQWEITLDKSYDIIYAGFLYYGFIKTLGLTSGGINGRAVTKVKNPSAVGVHFQNSLRCKIGWDLYDLRTLEFQEAHIGHFDRLPPLFTGIFRVPDIPSSWGNDKHLYIRQEKPYPCNILGLDVFQEVSAR